MIKVITLLGKPGAGKGTRLSEYLKGHYYQEYTVLVPGQILRREIEEGTELGMKVKKYMSKGELVPDDLINRLLLGEIKKARKTVILDGYPRTISQAKAMISEGIIPDVVVNVVVSDAVVLQRAADRLCCCKCGETFTKNNFKPPREANKCDRCGAELIRREDDEEAVVLHRLKVYEQETKPVLEVLKEADVEIRFIYENDTAEDFEAAMQ